MLQTQSTDVYLDIQKLADGVYAAIRKEPPGLAVDANVLFIINENDVVLVDANIGPESAGATLRALRSLTGKPISAIVATHYHDDHMGGTQTFLKDSPKAELIAHETSPKAIQELLKPARTEMIEIAPQMSKYLRELMDKGKSVGGWDIADEERTSYQNDIRIAERYGREMPDIPLPSPTRLVKDKLVLSRGSRTIEILHLGAGHTPSDMVVFLPKEKVVATGDLLVYPVPLVGGPQSSIKHWPGTLDKLMDLKASQIVPGHGPVLRDNAFPMKMRNLFLDAYAGVTAALKRGETLEQVQKSLDITKHEKSLCADSKVRKVLWDNYVKAPTIVAAFREASSANPQ